MPDSTPSAKQHNSFVKVKGMKQTMRDQLLTKTPFSLMLQLSIPAVLGMMVIGLYPLMDGVFAGHLIGETAMAACSVAIPLTFFNNGVATLIGVGSASVLSRALGRGDQETVDRVMGNLIFWVVLFSSVITVAGILFCPYFLDLLGATGDIKALAVRYLRVFFLGSLFVNFAQAANMVMRGEGLMKRAMFIMVLGAVLNILLDPILMLSFGDYAIEGAATASVVAQMIQAGVTLYYFMAHSETVKIGRVRRDRALSKAMFGVGVSAMIMQVFFLVQQTLLYRQAFVYGGEANAILMAAALRYYGFSFIPLWGMSQGLQPIIGTNFGAGRIDRVKETMWLFMIGGTLLATLFWVPAEVFTSSLLSLFNVNDTIAQQGIVPVRLFFSVFIFYGIMIMTLTYFQAIGDGKRAGIIVMLRQLVLLVPALLFIPVIFGAESLWWAQPLVDAVMIAVGCVMLVKSLATLQAPSAEVTSTPEA